MTSVSPENPCFIVYVGPMFGGKTSAMLMQLERFRYQNKRIVVFKPKLDDRYNESRVTTHSGWHVDAVTIENGADLLGHIVDLPDDPHVVAVDEAFMIENVSDALIWLYRTGHNVIVSTLDLSASGKPFREVEKMLPWCTRIEKCPAVCSVCGKDAYYTHRKFVDELDEIRVGGAEAYEPRCFSCHAGIRLEL
jgi:thymidine kinase